MKPTNNGEPFQFDVDNDYDGFVIDLKNLFLNHFDDRMTVYPIAYMKDGKTMGEIWSDKIRNRN